MNRIFISYSGSRVERAVLFNALRDHGLRPWRDVESLGAGDETTGVIEAELASCSGAILWIDTNLFASDYVAGVELPAIAKRARVGRFRLVPVFDGMSPSEASRRLSALGIEVGDSHGHVADPQLRSDVTAAQVATAYVRAHVKGAYEDGTSPVVRLVSYDDTAAKSDVAVLNLDWRHHLQAGSLNATSSQRLRAALKSASGAVKDSYGACEIELAVKAHLPLAVALGYAFSEPTGCTLRMVRDSFEWKISRDTAGVTPLKRDHSMRGPVDARRASVEVAVSRHIEAGVTAYVKRGNRYRHRVTLFPPDGVARDALRDPGAYSSWARQIAEELISITDAGDVDSIDLFLATPVELALSIGWWSNAAGLINMMNWKGKNGPYEPMWTLP